MLIQITDAGIAALNANGGQPLVLNQGVFGSGVNYIPSPSDTAIHGAAVFTTTVIGPTVMTPNVYRYSLLVDKSVGDWNFGEVGIYMTNGTLFALASASALIAKLGSTNHGEEANVLRFDGMLSMTGTNYAMWVNLSDSEGVLQIPVMNSVDQLPQSSVSQTNAWIVEGATSSQQSFLAISDRVGLWSFDTYKFATTIGHQFPVVSSTPTSVSLDTTGFSPDELALFTPEYLGQLIVQFSSGQLFSICRNVVNATVDSVNNLLVLGFATALLVTPLVNDTFRVYWREPLTTSNVSIPLMSATEVGGAELGSGLKMTGNTLSVDRTTVTGGIVYSVVLKDGSHQGDVTILASNIPGSVLKVNGTSPDSSGNVVLASNVPIATTTVAGVVRMGSGQFIVNPTTGDLSLAITVTNTVNARSGAVTIYGLLDPVALTSGEDLNNRQRPGIFYAATDALSQTLVNGPFASAAATRCALEVVPLSSGASSGTVVQRYTQASSSRTRVFDGLNWSAWTDPQAVVATTSSTGVVQIGTGLSITAGGVLTPAVATSSTVGVVKPGTGMSVDGSGSLTVAIATASTLGVAKFGASFSVAGDGTVSLASNVVTSVNSLTGPAVVLTPAAIDAQQLNGLIVGATLPTTPVAGAFYEYTGTAVSYTLQTAVTNGGTWPQTFRIYAENAVVTLTGAIVGTGTVTIPVGGLGIFQALNNGNYLVYGEIVVS